MMAFENWVLEEAPICFSTAPLSIFLRYGNRWENFFLL